jgi:tRNA pseudouridine38-40 synthase
MRNVKLTLAYDGTDYHGWQMQPNQPTIQGTLNGILSQITQEQIHLSGAGRTDAGVHAWGQVANFHTASTLTPQELKHALNALLPATIRVRAAEQVAPDFHARWSAEAKTYRYSIDRGPTISPFRFRYALHHPYPLDIDAMSAAAKCFEGQHDFTTFAASSGCEEDDRDRGVIRTIDRSELIAAPTEHDAREPLPFDPQAPSGSSEWVYVVRGRSFLRHMVRRIVGTLLEVGRGRLRPADVARLLELRDRSRSGPTAPPHGLCLVSVEFPNSREAPAAP